MVTPVEMNQEAPSLAQPKALPEAAGTYYLFNDIANAEAQQFCASLWGMATALVRVPGSRITMLTNSGGGEVGAGFAMIEMMYKIKRELGLPVDTVILGYAYSMGATVFQAGDHRRMGYFSTMMLHSASWQVSGRDSQVFTDMKRLSDLYQQMTAELFYRRTGRHSQQWWQRFIYSGKERYLSSQDCLKLGLVDEVCQFLDECYLLPAPVLQEEGGGNDGEEDDGRGVPAPRGATSEDDGKDGLSAGVGGIALRPEGKTRL